MIIKNLDNRLHTYVKCHIQDCTKGTRHTPHTYMLHNTLVYDTDRYNTRDFSLPRARGQIKLLLFPSIP